MAKLKKVKEQEALYKLTLTQTELDFMAGVMSDLADNPQRRVRMAYEVDGHYVTPSKKGLKAAKSITEAARGTEEDNYDYYDYWENIERGED